jgi:hypothetical protein
VRLRAVPPVRMIIGGVSLTESGQAPSDWAIGVTAALRDLSVEDMPSLEVLLIDGIGTWVLSPDNPGEDYGEQHGAVVISNLFTAIERAGEFRPAQLPAESEQIATARRAVVVGAHAIAKAEDGITLAVARIMPAAINELEKNARNSGAQIYWTYFYSLLAISSGTTGRLSDAVARGIGETFDAWDSLMAGGFRLPWHIAHDNSSS